VEPGISLGRLLSGQCVKDTAFVQSFSPGVPEGAVTGKIRFLSIHPRAGNSSLFTGHPLTSILRVFPPKTVFSP